MKWLWSPIKRPHYQSLVRTYVPAFTRINTSVPTSWWGLFLPSATSMHIRPSAIALHAHLCSHSKVRDTVNSKIHLIDFWWQYWSSFVIRINKIKGAGVHTFVRFSILTHYFSLHSSLFSVVYIDFIAMTSLTRNSKLCSRTTTELCMQV